jgi:uncharacterized protein (DUF486 family)
MNAAAVLPIFLLFGSNLVMNTAWYWHLRDPARPLWIVISISWGLALFEYSLAVPANRIGGRFYSLAQLKTIQEVITLATFVIVAWFLFGTKPGASQIAGFAMIVAGAALVFKGTIG